MVLANAAALHFETLAFAGVLLRACPVTCALPPTVVVVLPTLIGVLLVVLTAITVTIMIRWIVLASCRTVVMVALSKNIRALRVLLALLLSNEIRIYAPTVLGIRATVVVLVYAWMVWVIVVLISGSTIPDGVELGVPLLSCQ